MDRTDVDKTQHCIWRCGNFKHAVYGVYVNMQIEYFRNKNIFHILSLVHYKTCFYVVKSIYVQASLVIISVFLQFLKKNSIFQEVFNAYWGHNFNNV